MKVSAKWLNEWVGTSKTPEQVAEVLTSAGLEVDTVEHLCQFTQVVVAEVVSREQHPDADRLSVCQVNDGTGDLVQVVCGAKNVRQGLKIAFAQVGAVLPGDFKIKKAKLRGVVSHGMICAASELGLPDDSDGIIELPLDAPIGLSIKDYLELDDAIIDIELTANRGDCANMLGVAREFAVLNKQPLQQPEIRDIAATCSDVLPVKLSATDRCPRYLGRIIKGIDANAETPNWLKNRLERAGLRAIHPVVDVTNYVMLELGQPMHAFDLSAIKGAIDVRLAKLGEALTLLDEQVLTLSEADLVIADQDKALALAGIMGGLDSGTTTQTQDVFLESAFFAPELLSVSARKYHLQSDSSYRFARGVDFELAHKAMLRASQLLADIVGGQFGPIEAVSEDANLPKLPSIDLKAEHIKRLLGLAFAHQDVTDILTRLGMQVTEITAGHWQVVPPSWRFDVRIEADLIEELIRIHGYQHLPETLPITAASMYAPSKSLQLKARLEQVLVAHGFMETIQYSFVDAALQQAMFPKANGLNLANPIAADLAQMRVSLWPGLIKAAAYNLNRQVDSLRLFESGLVFLQDNQKLSQPGRFAGLMAGKAQRKDWLSAERLVDFFDVKAVVAALLSSLGIRQATWQRAEDACLHPGRQAVVAVNGQILAKVGQIHPKLQKEWDFELPIFVFELDLDKVMDVAELTQVFVPISKYPAVQRDLALVVPEAVLVADMIEAVAAKIGDSLNQVQIFDIYQGDGVASGMKSVAVRLTFQSERDTLAQEQVNSWVEQAMNILASEFNATLRA